MRFISLIIMSAMHVCYAGDILMVTMGGTKSHKIPFWELAKGLIPRGHNITFLNGFTADFAFEGLQEITPSGLVDYIQNYTNWDLLGSRLRGEQPVPIWDVVRYAVESCDAMMADAETKELFNRTFDLVIMDGAYPECAVAFPYKYGVPYMYINTVGFYTGSLSDSGSPAMYSVTPAFFSKYTDDMNLYQRTANSFMHLCIGLASLLTDTMLQGVLERHLGYVPPISQMRKNVSFILQNGHATVTYSRPFLPNVAEIACIHCKPAKPLPKDLEDFVDGSGDAGFIYVSMGSSVKAVNMPEEIRQLLIQTFARLPYRVLWKYEGHAATMKDLSPNVKISRWLPQQDILGHNKLRAFVTHGGLLSMFETVYHGVPVVTMPVFCDHDSNAAKAELDGYALKLELETLTVEKLLKGITQVIHEKKFKQAVKKRQYLLKDQRSTPLETAIYWTEYVIRHNGAYHLQTPARNLGLLQYFGLDVIALVILSIYLFIFLYRKLIKSSKISHASSNKKKLKNH